MDPFRLARPLLNALDPETAHRLTIAALAALPVRAPPSADPRLATRLGALALPSPIGLAAGFDKDARALPALLAAGFGFVEVGTLTPRAQAGNPRPRMFRLPQDRAVINRLGFNNGGLAAALPRLAAPRAGIVGVNVGANKDSADRIADYTTAVALAAPVADYLAVNISSPNTPGLRALQGVAELERLLEAVLAARNAVPRRPPLFVKLAPDLAPDEIAPIAAVALAAGIDGLILTNTTLARDALRSRHAGQAGGLSGAPLFARSTAMLAAFHRATAGRLPLIGVGGIASPADAYAKLRAGASAIQLYTALAWEGPALVGRMARGLATLLARDGLTLTEAVGLDAGEDQHR